MPSLLGRCWLGGRKGNRPVKNWWGVGMVTCLQRGADLQMAVGFLCRRTASMELAAY